MVAFTICSNNYLAFAKTLSVSWRNENPNAKFFIFLVDKKVEGINYNDLGADEVVTISEIGLEYFEELVLRYNITELNTSIKPDCFFYLFEKTGDQKIIYLDPDILVFDQFIEVEEALEDYDFVITPHILTPYYDDLSPSEISFMQTGLYNLGFIGVRKSEESFRILKWWKKKNRHYCYAKHISTCFTDQKWVIFFPIFNENTYILRHRGYNVANWNLHERSIYNDGKIYSVNSQWKLKFFHFSNFNFSDNNRTSIYNNRINLENEPIIKDIFENYKKLILRNAHEQYRQIVCYYYASPLKRKIRKLLINRLHLNTKKFQLQ